MKRIEIWQKSHISYYIAENIGRYSRKYKDAKEEIEYMPRAKYRRLLAALEKTASSCGDKIGRNDEESLRLMAALCTIIDTLREKDGVKAESPETLMHSAKEVSAMTERYLQTGEVPHLPSPALPDTALLLDKDEIVKQIRSRLSLYDRLTMEMFAMSKRSGQKELRALLDEIREKTGSRIIRPTGKDQVEMVMFLEKMSILRILLHESTDGQKIRPESMEALTEANRELNEASFMAYAEQAKADAPEELRDVVTGALEQKRKEDEVKRYS